MKPNTPGAGLEANDIRKELGNVPMRELVTEERIDACAQLIEDASAEFFADSADTLQQLTKLIAQKGDMSSSKSAYVQSIQTHAFNMRGHAKVLGFTLITEICTYIVNATAVNPKFTETQKQAILKQLIAALHLAFDKRIRDDGGKAGEELLSNLRGAF